MNIIITSLLFLICSSGVDALLVSPPQKIGRGGPLVSYYRTIPSNTQLHIEPVTTSVGIAIVSAAAGAATQMPKIQALERELASTKAALDLSEEQMVAKIALLEDKLFQMDNEFEQQTAKFQKQYDRKKQKELEAITEKLKQDMKYSLEIKVEEEKSRLLMDQLQTLSSNGGVQKQAELTTLKLKQSQLQESNLKLEQALQDAQQEMDRMDATAQKRGRFFGLF